MKKVSLIIVMFVGFNFPTRSYGKMLQMTSGRRCQVTSPRCADGTKLNCQAYASYHSVCSSYEEDGYYRVRCFAGNGWGHTDSFTDICRVGSTEKTKKKVQTKDGELRFGSE